MYLWYCYSYGFRLHTPLLHTLTLYVLYWILDPLYTFPHFNISAYNVMPNSRASETRILGYAHLQFYPFHLFRQFHQNIEMNWIYVC